ncbi:MULTISPECIES: M20/M25/M40 family metallo-hydrolase [unclassified Streptomyces]|uniref:M20/M25/M40 family metallo-hydrolase n=1 Tax=unclassified Streptomyces TaxID=2593676 RepID=UPI0022B7424B|nr:MULTISPECIES: M20/M25/M40 family metallo-hydrolase [unclassified Streptomyces]MCZ7414543.1 M20/M25/M40 family metallo-hydrolase [Streptomyces sp. WMMC897]MCZ7431470.1 M20/M25/M40 family metallo-hydrolase [Streptomyces sp. WMMC1477]
MTGAEPVKLLPADLDLLLELLELPTVGLLEAAEGTPPPRLWEAQHRYAEAAAALGFSVVHHAAAPASVLELPGVPVTVREAAARVPGFLAEQPSMVLRLGPGLPRERTVMFNVHVDTVDGFWEPSFHAGRFEGRGSIDAKGPAVALLAGVREAIATVPELGESTGVLIQLVSGEEGGAMGVFGTRPLVEAGHTGRLNVFCEPSRNLAVPRSTAAATARVTVQGTDSIDDHPGGGHNATVLLGHLAAHLAGTLCGRVPGTRVCVAGLHTGELHNKVYGSGKLLLNLAYPTTESGRLLTGALEEELAAGLRSFAERFAEVPGFGLTAAEAERVTRLEWLKRGLPALDGHDPWAEALLRSAGVAAAPPEAPACTCDAIWMHGVEGAHTVVLGPGDLDANGAHAAGEHADLTDLEEFAGSVAALLTRFAHATNGQP